MKKIIIVCEDLFGLEIYSILNEINTYNKKNSMLTEYYDIQGFICNNLEIFKEVSVSKPVLGRIDEWIPKGEIDYIMGIKNPETKEKYSLLLKSRGARFLTVITPWTLMPNRKNIGEGCVISNYSFKDRAVFGKFVTMINVMAGAAKVGDYTTVDALANITNAEIGEKVVVGAHAFLMEHIKVGGGAVIYPGSMVYANVQEGVKVAGIPANRIKYNKLNERK